MLLILGSSSGHLLPQIDDDVQRHNELLDVIRREPSEIGEIVARRRKDFTKEFFVHLHTVAESYHDDPNERNGEIFVFSFFCSKCSSKKYTGVYR